jgi:hypothetical protein
MGFNRRQMKARRAAAAEKKAAARRATEAQILEDASRVAAAWNERQAKRMPMLFSPTIGCALKASIGSSGCDVRPAVRPNPSIFGRSTGIPLRR